MNICCKYHDKLIFIDTDLTECAMAGMGKPTVCCENCSDNHYSKDTPYYYKTDPSMERDKQEWESIYGL